MDTDFWRGRSVFLTGHTGFKGAWLSLWLQSLGARVAGFALAPDTSPNLFESAGVAPGMRSLEGNLCERAGLEQAVREQAPEIVFHLAAQSLVRRSYREPADTFAINVQGTVNLLEAVRAANSVRAVVVVTSDKCYENREWAWGYRENDPMGGHDPYSASKGCAELVTAAYRRSFLAEQGVHVASVRAGNVIGGGDWAEDRLVPDLMRAFSAGQPVHIRYPGATRPWQHVLEPLHGYLLLAQRLAEGGDRFARGWNFGPDPSGCWPVRDVVAAMVRRWGEGARWTSDTAAAAHEATMLRLDSALAQTELGWRAHLDLSEALEWTLDWYRAYYRGGEDMRSLTFGQIRRFMARAASNAETS